jgi:hypothetical protein
MMSAWDIVDDVFSGPQVVEKCMPSRRVRSAQSSAVVAVVLAMSTAVGSSATSDELITSASTASVVLSRQRVKRFQPRNEERRDSALDFEVGRSAEQLARSFQAHFRPASDHDEDDQVSYVFS